MSLIRTSIHFVFGIALSVLIPLQAHSSASMCEALFITSSDPTIEVPKLTAYNGQLDTKRLLKNGFFLDQQGHLYDITVSDSKPIGALKTISPKKLYQWSDQEYHNELMQNSGIDREWMNYILKSPAQAAGVGFYVSVHPFDSAAYGTHVTVFDVNRPLVLFEYNAFDSQFNRKINETDFAKRARAAGIDGFRHTEYEKNWLSTINENILQLPHELTSAELEQILNANLPPKEIIKFLPNYQYLITSKMKNHVLIKLILKNELTLEDANTIITRYGNLSTETDRKQVRSAVFGAQKISEFKPLIDAIRASSDKINSSVIDGIYSKTSDNEFNAKMGLVDAMGLNRLAALAKLPKDKQDQKFKDYKQIGLNYENNLNKVSSAFDIQEIINFVEKTYGIKLNYRTGDPRGVLAQQYRKTFDIDLDETMPLDQLIKVGMSKFVRQIAATDTPNLLPKSIFDKYKLFLNLQPFAEHNDIAAKAFFIVVFKFASLGNVNHTFNRRTTMPFTAAKIPTSYYNELLDVGAVLKYWVIAGQTQSQMIKRAQQAVDFLKVEYPELADQMDD